MSERFDVVVVGSGFGGAVTACRLAQSGARVLVLERGRRWDPETYPRNSGDPWLYRHDAPAKHHGWLDLRFFRGMAVAQGAGVGGGSLCYSSVVMDAGPETFEEGWPREITPAELAPHADRVRRMLRVQTIPDGQRTPRHELLERAAERVGWGDRAGPVPLAVSFDEEYHYDLPDPLDPRHSKSFTNDQGVRQGTCVHLGNCDIGCDVQAKNTLDLNYVPAAEAAGAEVRPLHVVRTLSPVAGGGWRLAYERLGDGDPVPGEVTADRVILAAGSLGSTEILLRAREAGDLPDLSPRLGHGWSPNANFLTPDVYPKDVEVEQGIGPTITAGIDLMDGSARGERFFLEDDGFPNVLLNAVRSRLDEGGGWHLVAWLLRRHLERGLEEKNPLQQIMVWLGEGLDAHDGRLHLRRPWYAPWKGRRLALDWSVRRSRGVIDAIVDAHRRLSEAAGGDLRIPVWWHFFRALVTVHPLGGCCMGDGPAAGVVDHRGRVFGAPGLYVIDGAILPRPTGRNPSLTIAALAERCAELMVAEEKD